jgi:DNA-directed RNA polymerase I, II, and III subunit RPABC2
MAENDDDYSDIDAYSDNEEEDKNEETSVDVPQGPRELAKESKALQYLTTHHPECRLDYVEEVLQKIPLGAYPPDEGLDPKHKSVMYLTSFEKTKILGFRANQLAQGSRPFISPLPEHMTDVLEIAALELEQKRLPYILKRPMPNGTFEYVRLSDLIII